MQTDLIKSNRSLLLLIFSLMTGSLLIQGQALNFMTYNIRYATVNDGPDQWELRKGKVVDLILEQAPVAFGIQEGLHEQVLYLDSELADYAYLGVGRDTGAEEGEYCAIFYLRNELKVLDSGTFWLSESPERPSLGWDASYKRICTYALFEDQRLGNKFWLLNTHFDHRGVEARNQSAALILEKTNELNREGLPVLLMGDFNLTPETDAIQKIRKSMVDTRSAAVKISGPDATFNGFDLEKEPSDRIDFIFSSEKGLRILESSILGKKLSGRYPSDHFPVTAIIEFTNE